jgi:hypothetical protein
VYGWISRFNSFQANALLTAHEKGVHFLGEHISLKNGTFSPFLATIQPLSKTRVFLLSENKRRLHCIGHTLTANNPFALSYCPMQLSFSWESNPASRGAK